MPRSRPATAADRRLRRRCGRPRRLSGQELALLGTVSQQSWPEGHPHFGRFKRRANHRHGGIARAHRARLLASAQDLPRYPLYVQLGPRPL